MDLLISKKGMKKMEIDKTYVCNKTNYREKRKDSIKYIVIHYVGASGSAKDNAIYYSLTQNIGSSAHYFVGHGSENGKIYMSVPEESCAWHCGHDSGGRYYHDTCRNDNSIGIEMCCHLDSKGMWYFDEETVNSAIELVKSLTSKYLIPIDNVLRHYDVTNKICPAPFVNNSDLWKKFKLNVEKSSELESINDIVWELWSRKIITDKELWLKKLKEDINSYYLAKKTANYIKNMRG